MALLLKKSASLQRLFRFSSIIQSRALCCAPVFRLPDEDVKIIFESWAEKHGKVFENDEDKESKFLSFKDKLSRLYEEGANSDPLSELGGYRDWTREEPLTESGANQDWTHDNPLAKLGPNQGWGRDDPSTELGANRDFTPDNP